DLAGRKPGIDALAIGHRARRCQVVLLVHRRKGAFGGKLELPRPAAIVAIERRYEERDLAVAARGVERPLTGFDGVAALHEPRSLTDRTAACLRRHDHE